VENRDYRISNLRAFMAQHYELTYIVSVKYLEQELDAVIKKIADLVNEHKGVITQTENLGKQRLAYPINLTHQGTYVAVEFDLEDESNLLKLDKQMKVVGELLRYMIIKKRIKTAEEIEREKKIQERLTRDKKDELEKIEEKVKAEIKKSEEIVEEKVKDEDKKSDKKKMTLDELDKKLDEILTDDVI